MFTLLRPGFPQSEHTALTLNQNPRRVREHLPSFVAHRVSPKQVEELQSTDHMTAAGLLGGKMTRQKCVGWVGR